MALRKSRAVTPQGRARTYNNSQPLPSVYGMQTAGGAEYNDPERFVAHKFSDNVFPFFPTSWLGRIHTPVGRVSAVFGADVTLEAWDPRTGNRKSRPC